MDSQTQRGIPMGGGEESASRMTMNGPPAAPGAWKTNDVTIKQADNGGFIVRCSHTRESQAGEEKQAQLGGDTYKNEELAFGSLQDVLGYVVQAFGGQTEAPPAEAAPAPVAGAPDEGYEDMA